MLHSEETHKISKKDYVYLAIAKQMSTSVEQVKAIVNYAIDTCELFAQNDTHFWSERVMRNIEKREDISKKRSEAGKKSAETRNNLTNAEQVLTSVEQNPTKERKGKEIKEEEIKEKEILFERFWELYGKKKDRDKCIKKFDKLKSQEIEKIFETLPLYKQSTPDIQFRKNPLTYLNGRCWEDEIITSNRNTDPNGKHIDRRLHPDFPSDYVYCDMNIYYHKQGKIESMRKDGNFSDLKKPSR